MKDLEREILRSADGLPQNDGGEVWTENDRDQYGNVAASYRTYCGPSHSS